jgi:mRNA interferase MazF
MILYRRWDIILVPFPFTDLTSTKKRPCVVISPDAFNKSGDLIVGFITSNLQGPPRLGDCLVQDWQKAGLPLPSRFRMKFATINFEIVLKRIGHLANGDQKSINHNIIGFFA